ncbi:MAG: ATP synthase subunit delta [Verrucomicrobia subdivision 3 bacterium]|nr:ATP synthase subunit delta [Limisphaerales bacterium]MCS1415459.1 ATP synthase subunit delta [Limisphaerales bacterium]
MKINKQAWRGGKALFRSCLENDRLDENRVRSAVSKVLEQKPSGYLAVLSHFSRLVKLEVQRRTAVVESSVVLTPDLQAQVKEKLEGMYGSGLTIGFTENAALIGGIRVQVGSDVYDGSVRSRLNGLAASFVAS